MASEGRFLDDRDRIGGFARHWANVEGADGDGASDGT